MYSPPWAEAAKEFMPDPNKMDANGESKATDIMLEEREKETKVSSKARKWEEGRKKEWQANKKYYKKDRAERKQIKLANIVREVSRKY